MKIVQQKKRGEMDVGKTREKQEKSTKNKILIKNKKTRLYYHNKTKI